MGKIEEKKERKRRAIMSAARDVFRSEGFVLANMDRIAAEAQVTKQTVYRYFPSKIELFEATLKFMGESSEEHFMKHLENPDTRKALHEFARGFVQFHLSEEHLETFRLLVAESGKAPEITKAFFSVGPEDTGARLSRFFSERLGLSEPDKPMRLWTAMLLALRDGVLLGRARPTAREIEEHARTATDFLLAGISFEA
ncbi:MAG: TetR/AcrR family transcriptional regulator [Pseudomonadota bacterium]